jgi:hypothetical protein
MSLPDSFSYNDLKDTMYNQITREKWIYHLNRAIKKKKPKIILFNVAQSQELQRVTILLEEKGLRKTFGCILDKCMSFINNNDCIPVVAALESMYQYHIMSFFCFLAPVKDKHSNLELDLSKYKTEHLRDSIFL